MVANHQILSLQTVLILTLRQKPPCNFWNQGEVCSAGSRLIVQKEIEKILEKVSKLSETMKPADPLDPSSFAGAIVSSEQLEKINKYVNIGKEEGAEIKVGGNITMKETGVVILSLQLKKCRK